jgi:hypothetical protein
MPRFVIQYGAGPVIVWDRGNYEKLRGGWSLRRTGGRQPESVVSGRTIEDVRRSDQPGTS